MSCAIVTDAVALSSTSMPVVVAFIIDTPQTTPATFMSSTLYHDACRLVLFFSLQNKLPWFNQFCSTLCKTKLPIILVFNKTNVQHFALEQMSDIEELGVG